MGGSVLRRLGVRLWNICILSDETEEGIDNEWLTGIFYVAINSAEPWVLVDIAKTILLRF